MRTDSRPAIVCNTCTIMLVRIAYRRRPWFRLMREPLKAGMIVMGFLHGVIETSDPADPGCRGCVRFIKQGLKERSRLFRWTNSCINPFFDRVLGSIVTPEEVAEAQQHASRAVPRQ